MSRCNTPCPGYPDENCGGQGVFGYLVLNNVLPSGTSGAPKPTKSSDVSNDDDDPEYRYLPNRLLPLLLSFPFLSFPFLALTSSIAPLPFVVIAWPVSFPPRVAHNTLPRHPCFHASVLSTLRSRQELHGIPRGLFASQYGMIKGN